VHKHSNHNQPVHKPVHNISFIGMSGCGKSYWSKRLHRELGYKLYNCDDLIGEKIKHKYLDGNYTHVSDLSLWLGQPYEDGYSEREQLLLQAECEVMREIIADIKANNLTNVVIDTSGSVIYTENDIKAELSNLSAIVYLENSDTERLFERYVKHPKPVLWAGNFHLLEQEIPDYMALRRCYPELLKERFKLYSTLAQITIDSQIHNQPASSAEDLINTIYSKQAVR
jgi:shikimate kinase